MITCLGAAVLAQSGFAFRPPAASVRAPDVDSLFHFLTGVTVFFTAVIFLTIFYFMVKYRRRSEDAIPPFTPTVIPLEVTWTVIPTIICAVLFIWGSRLYFRESQPPPGSTEIFVVGKQWMWQLQHAEGQREIDALHIPVNVPIKLTMTSQDVIHDFFVPDFRVKQDVLPGRYTSEWFEATKVGAYHLFCAQYCGTFHSSMIGWIYVMEPDQYAQWLRENSTGESMVQMGQQLYKQFSCDVCHGPQGNGAGPSLQNIFGTTITLRGGETRLVDEDFLRQAIVNPVATPVANYPQIMPSFQGELTEPQILQLVAFIKSLGSAKE